MLLHKRIKLVTVCFFSFISVCTFCLVIFVRKNMFKIMEYLRKLYLTLRDIPNINPTARSQDYKLFLCLTQLSMKFVMLTNVKMPTIVGI